MCNCESLNKAENGLSNAPVTNRKAKTKLKPRYSPVFGHPKQSRPSNAKHKPTTTLQKRLANQVLGESALKTLGLGNLVRLGPGSRDRGQDWALGLGNVVGAGPYTLVVAI